MNCTTGSCGSIDPILQHADIAALLDPNPARTTPVYRSRITLAVRSTSPAVYLKK
jgi:hypothetical protein